MDVCALLVSCDPDAVAAVRRVLAKVGIDCETCRTTESALKLIRHEQFEGIIIDADDLEDGAAFLKTVRAEPSSKTSILFALVSGITSMGKAFQLGANFVLEKPLSFDRTFRCFHAAHGLMVGERRRYYRHPVDVTVYLEFGNSAPSASGTMIDVSQGGLRLRAPFHIPAERSTNVRFTLPSTRDTVEAQCSVIWSEEDRCGLRFVKLPKQSRSTLDRWLHEQMDGIISAPSRSRVYQN